ncbi:unnamed protein product [Brachionus calyciflorus]|uniref:Uncharacterized protein n=1 Tax=Brachionus calyciflorus TaxID=104777 RepID=A0A814CWI7_9BILA|nr:unnamed protein product [Brachionus calyciflorus]
MRNETLSDRQMEVPHIRVAKSSKPFTQAFISAEDLADNEWLFDQLDVRDFNELVTLRCARSRLVRATNGFALNQIRLLEEDNARMDSQMKQLFEENQKLKKEVAVDDVKLMRVEMKELEMEVSELRKIIKAIRKMTE